MLSDSIQSMKVLCILLLISMSPTTSSEQVGYVWDFTTNNPKVLQDVAQQLTTVFESEIFSLKCIKLLERRYRVRIRRHMELENRVRGVRGIAEIPEETKNFLKEKSANMVIFGKVDYYNATSNVTVTVQIESLGSESGRILASSSDTFLVDKRFDPKIQQASMQKLARGLCAKLPSIVKPSEIPDMSCIQESSNEQANQMRDEAVRTQAPKYASDSFQEAVTFYKEAHRQEVHRKPKEAKKNYGTAILLFRLASLEAQIKEKRALLEEGVKSEKVHRFAPQDYQKGVVSVSRAEGNLEQKHYCRALELYSEGLAPLEQAVKIAIPRKIAYNKWHGFTRECGRKTEITAFSGDITGIHFGYKANIPCRIGIEGGITCTLEIDYKVESNNSFFGTRAAFLIRGPVNTDLKFHCDAKDYKFGKQSYTIPEDYLIKNSPSTLTISCGHDEERWFSW